jgi:hypothetical protein
MKFGPKSATGLALVITLMMCSAAQAKIVPGKSIFGVTLGMTKAQVAKILGKPVAGNPATGEEDYGFRKFAYIVDFHGGHATAVQSRDPTQRTPRGLGVGSTLAQLKQRQPGIKCAGIGARVECHLGPLNGRHTTFDVFAPTGKVLFVIVAKNFQDGL